MEVVNYTPFPSLVFESRTPSDQAFGVLVLRATFAIVQGAALRPTVEQDPIALRDVYRGEPGSSSLRAESDLTPWKPRSDVHLDAVARAPSGKPAAEWPVRVRVGRLTADLLVRGPHVFQHFPLGGWKRTTPVRCTEVPICYERAFGGSYGAQEAARYAENPVGTGWIDDQLTPRDRDVAGAQVVALDEPEHRPGKRYTPRGFGPLPPNWEPRLSRAGTFDERWRRERWPRLPESFDFGFYNSAHPDLVYPGYLVGDEPVDLVHLSPAADAVHFRLPGYRMLGLVRRRTGALELVTVVLDTLHIDTTSDRADEHRAHLVWRGVFPHRGDERVLEVRMDAAPGPGPMVIPFATPIEVR